MHLAPISLAALLAVSLPASALQLSSHFDTGLGGTVTHAAAGYLQRLDTQSSWMSVPAQVGSLMAGLGLGLLGLHRRRQRR